MFCIVTVVRAHVLYSDSGTCACFVLCQWYVYMFLIVAVVREKKVLKILLKRKKKSLTSASTVTPIPQPSSH